MMLLLLVLLLLLDVLLLLLLLGVLLPRSRLDFGSDAVLPRRCCSSGRRRPPSPEEGRRYDGGHRLALAAPGEEFGVVVAARGGAVGFVRGGIRRGLGPRHPVPVVRVEVVEVVALGLVEVAEEAPEVGYVGVLLEAEAAAVGEVLGELAGAAGAEGRDGDLLLLFEDELVLAVGRLGLEALPGEAASEEVDEDVADGLEVVSPGLLDALMVRDRRVPRRTRQRLAGAVGDVLHRVGIPVPLAQAEVDAIDRRARSGVAHDKIRRLYIAVNQVAAMQRLDALEHLVRQL
mmetsp:Transcript_26465/g.85551  ORF Transcript_26465/g.85551 Transcript_26465/m.85551 type:complete len:289 (+) Transcript_26465:3-869(+)